MVSRLRWDSSPSLGLEVVPEVVQMTAMSSGVLRAISSSNQVGCCSARLRPLASTSVKSTSHGSS